MLLCIASVGDCWMVLKCFIMFLLSLNEICLICEVKLDFFCGGFEENNIMAIMFRELAWSTCSFDLF